MTGRGGRGGAGGAGTGSPIHFACPVARRERNDRESRRARYGTAEPGRSHHVTLTGATKPYPTHKPGARSTRTSRQWTCECGATGWSNHVDLERMERRMERDR